MARIILMLELATLCVVAIGVARIATDWRVARTLPNVYTFGK